MTVEELVAQMKAQAEKDLAREEEELALLTPEQQAEHLRAMEHLDRKMQSADFFIERAPDDREEK